MTANELADKLMESNSVSWGSCTHEQHDNDKYFKEQAATMLRQQAKKIEDLLDHNVNLIDDLFSERKEVIRLEAELNEAGHMIGVLREEISLLKENMEKTNEPVAWATEDFEEIMTLKIRQAHIDHPESCTHKFFPIPLYTHPNEDRDSAIYATGYWKGIEYKKMRELTDEEINKLWAESHEDGIAMQKGFTTQQHYFAHLILKKASEK